MLINLTNHPFDTWSQKQQETAIVDYGVVHDVPFPHIAPQASYDEVMELALAYWQKVEGMLYGMGNDTILIMGELVFCHIFVGICQDHHLPCIASTTKRVVEQQGDRKISHYEFVRFRPYFSTEW